MVDVNAQIDAVSRSIATKDIEGVPSHVQTLSQTYTSPIEDVWDAVTSPERIPRWFLPISGDLRVGGTYQFAGNAGGRIVTCDPPSDGTASYEVTWGMGQGEPAVVRVRLSATGSATTRLDLENVATASSLPEGFWEQFGPSATGIGWDSGLLGLALHVASDGHAMSPEEGAAWSVTDEGKTFMRLSADAWADAATRDGVEPQAARTAADTVYGMYTGEVPPPEMG